MAFFAQVKKRTDIWGVAKYVRDFGSHIPEATPPNYAIDITSYTPQPVDGEAWWYNFNTDLFTDVDPAIPAFQYPVEIIDAPNLWLTRLTSQERAYTWAVCNGETPPGVTITLENRYRIGAFKDITLSGLPFALDNAELVAVIDGMESAGIIGAGRAAEILG